MHIGYIGLGAMGGALARRLLATHTLSVWDINSGAVAALRKLGASAAPSGADLAKQCDVLLLCLPRSSDVRRAIFGPGGLAEGLSPNKLVIDQTSGSPSETREIAEQLAAQGVAMIDAPISGSPSVVTAGAHTIMASGPDEAYKKALPVLQSLGPNVYRCGKRLGDAQAMKLVNNAMNAGCRLATLELVAMGRKIGLSLETITDVINTGLGRNGTSKFMLPAIIEGRRSTNFAMSLMLKDLNQAISLGQEYGAPMAITNIVRGLLQIGVNTLGETAQLEDVVGLIESMAATRLVKTANAATPPDLGTTGNKTSESDGQVAKLIDNAVAACNRLITYECVAMGFKYGLAIDDMSKVINKSSGWSVASEQILPLLASGGQTSNLQLKLVVNDLKHASQMGIGCGAPMLIANAVRSIFEVGAHELSGTANLDEMARLFESMSDIKFGSAGVRPTTDATGCSFK